MSKQNKVKGAAPLDDRFARITYDPSFKSMKKDQKKVKIDKRFTGVFTDKKFKVEAKTDKYGNKLEVEDGVNKEMEQYYYKDEEEEQDENESQDEEEEEVDAKPIKKSKKDDKKKTVKESSLKDKSKKKSKKQESEEDEDSEEIEDESESENQHEGSFEWNEVSSSDEDIEFQDEEDNQEEFYYGVDKEKPVVSEATSSKLAVLNYDWMNLSAQDLILLFNSFKDKVGVIKRVSVYPSEYGLKQLEEENMQGPKNIWKKQEQQEVAEVPVEENKKELNKYQKQRQEQKEKEIQNKKMKKNQNNDSDDEFVNENTKHLQKRQQKSLFESRKINLLNHTVTARIDDDQGDLDPVALREYERQRMRYYYAVIECDKKSTAEKIYDACDGMEFEMSGIPIDLRFVPEDQVFPYEPKEICEEVPTDSQVKNIVNRSIGHTNTRLTWDQPQDRFKFLDGKMTEKDYDKIDWSKYVASGDNEGDEDDEFMEESDNDFGMEELDSDAELAALEQQALRQQQEIDNMNWKKGFDKKNRKKKEGEIEIKFNQGFDDLGNKILEKQKRQNETKFETTERHEKDKKKQRKQEIKEKIKMHKNKKLGKINNDEDTAEIKKQKAQLSLIVEKEDKQDVKVDLSDPRFQAIYETRDYAIDPTSKYYNKDSSAKILDEQIKQRKKRKLNEEQ